MNNLDAAAKALNGMVWLRSGKRRVYLKPDFKRNQKIYIEFDEILLSGEYEHYMQGAKLCCYTDVPTQPLTWNVNASKQLKHKYMQAIAEHVGWVVTDNWRDVIVP